MSRGTQYEPGETPALPRRASRARPRSLEVKEIEVPGWQDTGPNASWPSYSRVVHQKFIVSDQRLNVGTSNMQWSYFHNTAGASWNTNASTLIAQAEEIFERDWESDYSRPIPALSRSS